MDWAHVPMGVEDHVPVINLIQHPRHALPDDPRAAFLTRRATRCVSEEVSQAIRQTGRANGPVHTIAAGVKGAPLSSVRERSIPVLICGLKNPALAQATAQAARPWRKCRRPDKRLAPHRLSACSGQGADRHHLPDATEGFYLRAGGHGGRAAR
jgi:hypothetical protein